MDLGRALVGYYGLGTLVFWALDMVLAAPIRASFIEYPAARVYYYLGLLGLAAVCRWKPRAAPVVGMLESSVNLLLVLLSILLPVWSFSDDVLAGGDGTLPFTTWTMLNVLLSGSVMILTFQRSRAAFERDFRRGGEGV